MARARRRRASGKAGDHLTDAIHDRTARFYKTLLRAGTITRWAKLIETTEVEISADPTWAVTAGAQRLLVALVIILSRCFGRVTLRGIEDVRTVISPVLVPRREQLADSLAELAREIVGSPATAAPERTVFLHVGPRPVRRATPTVAARGWRAWLWGPGAAPSQFDGEPNVAGAVLAALLGATAAVRAFIEKVTTTSRLAAWEDGLIRIAPDLRERYAPPLGSIELSAWDPVGSEAEPTWQPRDLGRLVFASLGAVNGALLVILLLAGDVRADIEAYEPQRLGRTNLNRYWFAVARWIGRAKVRAAELLSTASVMLHGHQVSVDSARPPFAPGAVVVSGADNDAARHAAQRLARGPLISLATEVGQVHVSAFRASGRPCAACLFPGSAASAAAMPTHPVVAGWAGLLGFVTLLRGAEWLEGRELRLAALRPSDRPSDEVSPREGCAICGGGSISSSTVVA